MIRNAKRKIESCTRAKWNMSDEQKEERFEKDYHCQFHWRNGMERLMFSMLFQEVNTFVMAIAAEAAAMTTILTADVLAATVR